MRECGPAVLNHHGEELIVQCHNHMRVYIMCRGHQQRFSYIADDSTGPLTGTADDDTRNRVPDRNHLLHLWIASASAASSLRWLLKLPEALVRWISKNLLGMSTDPPKELLFKEGLELCYPVGVLGKLSHRLSPPGAFQVLEKQGVALYPRRSSVLHIGSIGCIDRILAAEIVDVAIIDLVKIEGTEQMAVLRVLDLVLDFAQIKQTPIQGA